MAFQIVMDKNRVIAVFTSGKEYRSMLWLFPEDAYSVFNYNGYPAVKLLAWNSASVFDAMLHG